MSSDQTSKSAFDLLLIQREQQDQHLSTLDLKAWCGNDDIKLQLLLNALAADELKWGQPSELLLLVKEDVIIPWGRPLMGGSHGKTQSDTKIPQASLVRQEPPQQTALLNKIMNDVEQSGISSRCEDFPLHVIKRLFNIDCITVPTEDFRRWHERMFANPVQGRHQVKKKKPLRPIDMILKRLFMEYPNKSAKELWNVLRDDYLNKSELDPGGYIQEIKPRLHLYDKVNNKDTAISHSSLQGQPYKPITFETFEKRISSLRKKL